jgi:pimeloyl-ACP methyl ester carboxylesterase
MPFYEKGDVRLCYEDVGQGFPLLNIPGGGLNSCIADPHKMFDVAAEFGADYRCITLDMRHANRGQSSGPLEMDAPWDACTADQLAVLDHLGVDRFMVLGSCIGNPLMWNLIRHAPDRVVAGVAAQPSFVRAGQSEASVDYHRQNWLPKLLATRPEITPEKAEAYLQRIYGDIEFIGTVSRAFVAACRTPLLVLPDDIWSHPYDLCMEMVHLAPNAQVSLYPWKDKPQNVALAVRHIRTFLKANRPDR